MGQPMAKGGAESGRSGRRGHAAALTAVCLHGAGGGPWEWARWLRLWGAEGFQAQAPPLPELDDLEAVRRRLQAGLSPGAVLVGASLGGLLALQLARVLHAPALVLVNPLPPEPWSSALPQPAPGYTPDWGLRARLDGTRRAVPELDPVDALLAFRGWRDCSPRLLAQARHGQGFDRPGCPVLVIASAGDSDVPAALSSGLAQALGADLLGVPGSHVAPLLAAEAPRLARYALEWLRGTVAEDVVSPSFSGISAG